MRQNPHNRRIQGGPGPDPVWLPTAACERSPFGQAKAKEAEPLYRRDLFIKEGTSGPGDFGLATSLNNLAARAYGSAPPLLYHDLESTLSVRKRMAILSPRLFGLRSGALFAVK